jgi:uncharacterized protein YwqG
MVDIYKWLFGARGRSAVTLPIAPLPEELETYRTAIEGTVRPVLAAQVHADAPGSMLGCQLGGEPWWPAGEAYPQARDGSPMYLLVQLNFAEMPVLEPFPRTGLLQVFIAADPLYGADLDDPLNTAGFRIVHHTDLDRRRDRSVVPRKLPGRREAVLPLEQPLQARGLSFLLEAMAIDPTDHRFSTVLGEIAEDDTLLELYAEWHEAGAIRLGGYPNFTQEDPRAYIQRALGSFNLLTIDSTDGIMWGDSGVAQFFIEEADLAKQDFSKVGYNWDCC